MNFLNTFASLFSNFGNLTWQMVVMWGIGALLIYLAIAKKMEPSLLLPMGFGAILVNLPLSGAITQGDTVGPISALFEAGMSNELFPLLLFIGIGAMIDFGPLLEKPWLMLFGAAAQFGIFFTLFLAGFFFDLKDAASIAVIGAADGPTAIFVANTLNSQYLGAIMVAAYSYMALVPIVQPPAPGSPGTSSDWPEATFWREPMSLVSRSLASVTPKRLAIEAYDSPRREW